MHELMTSEVELIMNVKGLLYLHHVGHVYMKCVYELLLNVASVQILCLIFI